MSEQHFLPASYIGRFSAGANGRLRKRTVWVQRVGREPYAASAEYVGRARHLYDREKPSADMPTTIDGSWLYESRLSRALDALVDGSGLLDGRLWAQVLVPFVSSLFIRGVEFIDRYQTRLPGLTGPPRDDPTVALFDSWHDSTLDARHIEWQRILAPIMAAQWTVVHGSGEAVLPTNDVAHCLMTKIEKPGEVGYAVPLTPSSVLVLEGRTVRRVMDWTGATWIAPIEHRDTSDDDLRACRRAIQHGAFKEVYGPTKAAVEFPTKDFQPSALPIGPGHLLPSERGRALLPYIEDYFKVLTLLELDAQQAARWDGDIDWSIVARSWAGSVQLIVDAPRFPGGLAAAPWGLYLDLTRFSVDEVESSIDSGELPAVSGEPSPALLDLMNFDLAQIAARAGGSLG